MRRISGNCYILDMLTFAPSDGTWGTGRVYEELPVRIYRSDKDYNRKENDLCNSDVLYIVLGDDVSKEQSVHIMTCDVFLEYLRYVTTIVCAMRLINGEGTSFEDKAICNHIVADTTRSYARMANAQDGRKLTILAHLDKNTNNYTQVSVWYHGIGQLYINPKTFTDDFLKFCLDCATDNGCTKERLLMEGCIKQGVSAYNIDMSLNEYDEKVHDIFAKMSTQIEVDYVH